MKYHLNTFGWPLVCCLFLAPRTEAKEVTVPSTEQLMRVLIRNQSLILDVGNVAKGCQIETQAGTMRSVGDYLAHLTSALIPDNGQNLVTSSCESLKNDQGQACEVWFSTGGGTETPWRYGIQFRVDIKGKIDRNSIRCPGTP